MKAVLIDKNDNVAVLLGSVQAGDKIIWTQDEQHYELVATQSIPAFHKIAIHSISSGDYIVKYGEHIGIAMQNIMQGGHVHVHNVQSNRERL